MRYYRLASVTHGTLPEHEWLKVGAIIRVPRSNSHKPGPQWNADEAAWVTPVWVECADPKSGGDQ